MQAEQRLRFRPSAPIDERLLTALPEVRSVSHNHTEWVVTGTGDLLQAVTTVLVRHQIWPLDLHLARTTLEDAYVALTDHQLEETPREGKAL